MRFNLGRGAAVVAAALCASAAWAGTASADPEWPTITTITASPDRVAPGASVTYTITVVPDLVSPSTPEPTVGGTVSLKDGSTPIPECQDVTVTNGSATCSAPATLPSGTHYVTAFYLGDEVFSASTSVNPAEVVVYNVASIVGSTAPNPVERLTPIVYTGIVDGIRLTSEGGAPAASYGTVAFEVDGQPIDSCQEQTLMLLTSSATCVTIAPATGGEHTLKVSYSGDAWSTPATHTSTFTVLAPAVSAPASMDFGSVEAGKVSQRSITLTNSGTLPVEVNGVDVTGPFAATSDSCKGKTLAVGATCAVVTTYTPSAVGAQSGSLTFDVGSGIGKRTTALTATGVAAPVPPAPTVTPPPPAPQPGGTFAPGKKPTLTVNAPSSSKPGATPTVQVPLSCPATEECDLSGQLTISTSAFARAAHSAAAGTTKIAHFSGVQVKAGGLKTVKLKLSKAFIKKAQKRGIRRIQATLTVTTVFGTGQQATTKQQVTVLIPKAPKRKAAAKVAPRFTG
ncbi:MAG TPA: Ig-like domain repeat protein [Solirubrobacter sp.]|nr:Ig-like domain repeat protein [Solirubrobacter sp.]